MSKKQDVVVTVRLFLDDALWAEVESVIRAQGWREEEGLRILLGYGAAVHLDPLEEDSLAALGAIRAELATLRHRAFLADEALRTLRMNRTGLAASLAQGHRSVRRMQRELSDLRERARKAGVVLTGEAPPDPREEVRRRLRGLFERPGDQRG